MQVIYTYGLNKAEKAVVNVVFPRVYKRIDCTGDFQCLLAEDAACACISPAKLTEEQWGLLEARYTNTFKTLLMFTQEPKREVSFPYLISGLAGAISGNREKAIRLLKRASFPCLFPIDEKTGNHHMLNDGFVVLDIETSGLDPRIHEITKVWAVRVANFHIVDRFETLVHIHRPMEPKTEKLIGITNEMLEHAPGIREVLERLTQWYPMDPVVFYHGEFDSDFLYTALLKTGTSYDDQRQQIDLLNLACRLYTAGYIERKLTLSSTAEWLLGETKGDDENDAVLSAELLIFFLRKLRDEFGFRKVNDLLKLYPLENDNVL